MALSWTLSSLPELQHLSKEERTKVLSRSIDWIVHAKITALPLMSGVIPIFTAAVLSYKSMFPIIALVLAMFGVSSILFIRLWLIARCRKGLRQHLYNLQVQGIFITCLKCGFDLRGSSTGTCPECGNEPQVKDETFNSNPNSLSRGSQPVNEGEAILQKSNSSIAGIINISGHPRALRLAIASFIIIVILLLIKESIHNSNLSRMTVHRSGHISATYSWHIEWGEENGKLEFVVFEGYPILNPNDLTGLITFTSDVKEGSYAWLNKPDGTRIKFPSKFVIIEYIDGEYRESTEQVSLDTFESYLATKQLSTQLMACCRMQRKNRK